MHENGDLWAENFKLCLDIIFYEAFIFKIICAFKIKNCLSTKY
jgi:hypothetical protein